MTQPPKKTPEKPKPEPHWIVDGAISRPVHVVCSPYKTGTTSVGKALVKLGVGARDMGHEGALLRSIRPRLRELNRLAMQARNFPAFAEEHTDHVRRELADLVLAITPYDVFHDAPFGHGQMHVFLRKVLAPQARFIWVNRDPEDWLTSVRNWEETHPETYPNHTEWQTDPEGRGARKLRLWNQLYRQYKRIRRFHTEDCLELEWADLNDWTRLAQFYGVEVPEEAFPRANVSSEASQDD